MPRPTGLFFAMLLATAGCQPAAAPLTTTATAKVDSAKATGPRWVVLKVPSLTCESCAEQVRADLEKVAGIGQLELFSPQPYCRFYVQDSQLDVQATLDEIATRNEMLEGYSFIRGG